MADFWAARPPEVNDLVLRAGSGIATTAAAALTYVMEISGCETAAGMSIGNAGMLAPDFVGLAGAGSLLSATTLNTTLQLLAGWLMEKPPVFASAINAYLSASSAMIPAAVCQGNRVQWESLCAANVPALGTLTPAIIEKDLEYFGGMWPNNAGVGTGYSAVLMGLIPALSIPPPITPLAASPAAPVQAGAAVAEAAATGAVAPALQASGAAAGMAGPSGAAGPGGMLGDLMQQVTGGVQQGGQAVGQLAQNVVGMPMQLGQTLTGPVQALTGLFGSFGNRGEAAAVEPVVEAVPEAVRPGVGLPLAPGAGSVLGGAAGAATPAGLTSYTRPTAGFAPEPGGRPTGLRGAGVLGAVETRTAPAGGVPVGSGAGMLARPTGGSAGSGEVGRVRVFAEAEQRRG
ncbi:PPE domain-containing protein [Mycolicibacterium fallax]|uniref:PPE domain-containing protein n=1 Tax=Mycolicibacterium fallax TaxID=1793 RepID=A0A1X1RHG6_MYCFA|nr:PPE domain-containing protein [Mycolicibacterium fallax]ORV06301.1 hypothetical protein AWC04_05515 [Mycolicibacterium fallax]BBY97681.1 PPE family protein [Mycolicibacterium fallax]HSA39037.1 PPE domain-containing protein [Mycobacterium sp.]